MNKKRTSKTDKILGFFGKSKVTKNDELPESIMFTDGQDKDLRIGIVGAGRMGVTHYSIINGLDGVSVVAIADNSKQLLSMLDKYMTVSCYSNWETMLANETLDAVLICTPPTLNNEILESCVKRNLHVFIEKPFLINSAEAKQFSELFSQKGLINQVGYVNRYNAIFMHVKRLLDENSIGKVVRFKSEMFSSTVNKPQSGGGWRASQKSGGGVTFEMATHALDLVIFLFGSPSKVCGTGFSKVFSRHVDDIASTNFVYDHGLIGSMFVNWSDCSRRKPVNSIEVIGTEGTISADQYELRVFMNNPSEEHKLKKGWNVFAITDLFYSVPFYVRGNEFTLQLLEFVKDVRSKSTHKGACSFSEAATTLRIIEEMTMDFNANAMEIAK